MFRTGLDAYGILWELVSWPADEVFKPYIAPHIVVVYELSTNSAEFSRISRTVSARATIRLGNDQAFSRKKPFVTHEFP